MTWTYGLTGQDYHDAIKRPAQQDQKESTVNTLTAKNVTITSLAGQRKVTENAFGRDLGFFEVVKGFAHFTGYANTAAEGVVAVVRGGHDGLVKALAEGLVNGRDDRH